MSKKSVKITIELPLDVIVKEFEAAASNFYMTLEKKKLIKLLTTSKTFKKKFTDDILEIWSVVNGDNTGQLIECYEEVFTNN